MCRNIFNYQVISDGAVLMQPHYEILFPDNNNKNNKMLSYRRETALQGTLVLAESGRLELGDNILRTL